MPTLAPTPSITLAIVALTFIGIAIGRFPVIKSNHTTILLLIAVLWLSLLA